MMRLTKRVFSAFLAFVMVFTMLPLDAWAADNNVTGNSAMAPLAILPDDENTHYITYIFKNGDQVVSTQILTKDDILRQPATPEAPEGKKFVGWKTAEGQEPVYDRVPEVQEDQQITYLAQFEDVIYVTFLSQDGNTVLAVKEVGSGEQVNDDGVTFLPDAGTMFQHWSETMGGSEFNFYTPITEDITLYAVCTEGCWVVFDSDGGTHVDTQYVAQGGTAVEPTRPTKTGYNFEGWTTPDGKDYNFNDPVNGNLTLKAKWVGQMVDYTVVFWLQDPNNAGEYNYYDSVLMTEEDGWFGSVTDKRAQAGSTVTLSADHEVVRDNLPKAKKETRKTIGEFSRSDTVVIAGDGTSVVNVYYDRTVFTYSFNLSNSEYTMTIDGQTYRGGWNQNQYQVKAKYEQDISSVWPSIDNAKFSLGSSRKFTGWSQEGAYSSNGQWATNRLSITDDMLPRNGQSLSLTIMTSRDASTRTVNYWFEALPGQAGDKRTYRSVDYIRSEEYSQNYNWTSSSLDAKSIDGMKVANGGNSVTFEGYSGTNFIYTRNRYELSFDTQGGPTEVDPVPDIMFEENLSKYKPTQYEEGVTTKTVNDVVYTFTGWYTTDECYEKFNFNSTMPNENLKLFAGWEKQKVDVIAYITAVGSEETKTYEVELGEKVSETELNDWLQQNNQNVDDLHGWYQYKDGAYTAWNFDAPVRENITLVAIFGTGTYGITYLPGVGTGSVTDTKLYSIGSQAVVKPATGITPPEGKKFLYWQTKDGEIYYPNDVINITGDITLTAHFADPDNMVTLTYHGNGGTLPGGEASETVSVTANRMVSLESNSFVNSGYEFVGWSENQDADPNGADLLQPGSKVRVTADGKNDLYAIWKLDTAEYTINYYVDDEPTSNPYTGAPIGGSAQIGTTVRPAFSNSFKKDNTTFVLDEGEGNLSVEIKAEGENVLNVYYYGQYTVTYQWADGTTVPDGVQPPTDTSSYTKDTVVNVLQPEGVENYKFNGWKLDGEAVGNTFEMPAKNVTLIGSWTQTDVTYTVEHYIQYLNTEGNSSHAAYELERTESGLTAAVGTVVSDDFVENLEKLPTDFTDKDEGYDGPDTEYEFTYDHWDGEDLSDSNVIVDGSVIKLYYNRVLKSTIFDDKLLVTAKDSNLDGENEIRQGRITVVTHYEGGTKEGIHSDAVWFRYQDKNMVDLKISVDTTDSEYELYAINASLAEKNDGWNGKVLDNVVGGSTVDIYLVPVYTVEYYKVDGGTTELYKQDEGTYTNTDVSKISGNVWTDTVETQFTTIDLPDETGYTYSGWYTNSSLDGIKVDPNTSNNVANYVNSAEDRVIKFYAGNKVANTYTVTYEWDGSAPEDAVLPNNGGPIEKAYGNPVNVLYPKDVPGYTFNGWTVKKGGVDIGSGTFTMPANDVVLVGSWTANDNTPYEVQWYYQNADGSYPTTTSVTDDRYGTTGTVASVTATDKAATQGGLYVYDEENTSKVESATIKGDGSTVLKLYFKRAEFTVSYQYSGTAPEGAAEMLPGKNQYKWGVNVSVDDTLTEGKEVDGYVFSGWNTADANVVNGSFEMPQKDVNFTGSWTKLYTVTYDPNGGLGNPYIVDVKDGENHTVLDNTETDFTKTNYHFVGWNAQADGSGESYLKDAVISGISSNITLYAQWEIDKVAYTIEYYLDGDLAESPYAGAPAGGSADIGTPIRIEGLDGFKRAFDAEDGGHYVLDEHESQKILEITIDADTTKNVLKVYYASDNKGGGDDGKDPDEIPDKYQVIFRYVAGLNGSITGIRHETVTKSNVVPTAQPSGTAVKADDGYKFQKWTRSTDSVEDTVEEMTTFKEPSYSWNSEVTFTVHFTKRTDLEYTINYYWVGDKDNQSRIPIRDPETKSDGTLGDTVTLNSINVPSIDGYTLIPGDYKVTISANEAANVINVYYYKNVKLTANSDEKVYTGEVQTVTGFTVTGEVDGVEAEFVDVIASGSGTNANTEENPSYPVTFTGVTVNETLDTNGYYIVTETVDGKLIINPATMTLNAEGYNEVYDGKEHGGTVSGYPDGAELLYSKDGGESWSKVAPTVTDYTENPVTVQVKVTLANYTDATATYTLNVEKRPVILVSEGDERPYNGQALTNANWYYEGEYKFVNGEVTNIRTIGTQTEIGSSKNTIAYDKSDGFKESNYQITIREGDLVVTPPQNPNEYDVVTKTHDKDNLNPGEFVTFTITVKNIFADTATVTLNELPGVSFSKNGTNKLTFQLNGGETKEVEATYTITETDVLAGKFVNEVSATLVVGDQTVEASATDTVTLKAAPALTVDKTVTSRPTNGSTYALGETITWSITVTNSGNVTLKDIQVSDSLTYQGDESGNKLSGTLTPPAGFDGNLDRGESVTYTYSYQVAEADLGKTLVNTATATGKDSNDKDAEPDSDEADPVRTDDLKPSLSVTKTADRETAAVGETINYTITVTNNGNQTLNSIKVTDPLTGLEQTIAKLEPDETSEAIPTTYTVQVSDLVKGKVTNIATATAGSVTAEANETVVITGSLNISVTLNSDEFTYDGQEHTVSGIESVTYGNDVISVNNATFEIGDTTFTLSCAENTATATGTNVVRNPDGTVGSYPVTAQPTDITVKMGGQNVTGKVTVTNVIAGSLQINPRKATITVQDAEKTYGESDPTPFQAVLSGDPLVNDTDLGTITCSRTNKDEDAGVYEDVLTASYTDNKNYDVTVVNGDFTIKKYTLPVVVTIEGTSAEKPYTGSEQSVEGYMITGITVNGVESELYPEASVQFVGEPYDKVASGTYVGEYSMALNKDDFENGNANFTNVTFQVTPGKLTITPGTYQPVTKTHEKKQDGSDLFALNETVTFPITVVNIYNTPAKVTLKEQEGVFFEGGSQTAEQVLGPGDKMIFNAYYDITEQDILNESFTNTVEWTIARIDDSEKITGTAADTVEVVAKAPKLTVSKAVKNSGDAPFDLDETITYTITVKNDGNVTVTGINVADLVTTEGENRQAATVNTEAFALKPGEDKSFEYTYKVQQSDLGKTILNTATATGSDPTGEEVVGTDDVEAETEERNPELDVTKVASKPANGAEFVLDETITYTITVKNTGNVTLADIFVSDEFSRDDGATWDVQKDKLTPSASTPITLEPGEQKIYTYQYTVVEEDLGKTLVNTATATAEQTEPEDPNKPVEDKDETDGEKTEDPTPNMTVDKTVVNGKASYQVGDVITYEITVNNTGNTTIHNVELMDHMNAHGKVTFKDLGDGQMVGGSPVLAALAPKTAWVVTCQYTVQLADADSDGTVISNKVVVTSDEGPDDDSETPGEKVDPIYTLTIKYQNGAKVDLRNPDTVKLHAGDVYTVVAPGINGYHLSDKADAEFKFTMPDKDTTIVIIYAANPVEDDDDDPVVNPDNDPDETTEETEDEVDPGVYIEDPDDYTLTPITEEEPPLADLDVGDHTCCIMHFLLMLAAMVVLGFYTDSKKKHQARIFELKRTLAMEKGKNPDGDNSQQS